MSVESLAEKGYEVFGDYLVVKPDEFDEIEFREGDTVKLKSGVFFVEGDKDNKVFDEAVTGVVVAVGPGKLVEAGEHAGKEIPLPVKIGDHVYHSKYGVTEIEINEEVFYKMDRKALIMRIP